MENEEYVDPNQLEIPFDWEGDEVKTTEELEEQDRAFIRDAQIDKDVTISKRNSHVSLVWKCGICGDKIISDSRKRHSMDVCECGKSGVDLEDWYQRNMGNVIEISRRVYEDNDVVIIKNNRV